MQSADILLFACIVAILCIAYRNYRVYKFRGWMNDEWFARSIRSIRNGHSIHFNRVYDNAPAYYHMVLCFWIPLSRFRREYLDKLNKFSEIMNEDKKMKHVIEYKDNELKNAVYKSVLGICERIEHDGSYKGNGHHLAQKITDEVVSVLSE